jgi:hypothetical protein
MRRLLSFLLLLSAAAGASAQSPALSGDGRRSVEKPGIALVKPQKWSKPNEAQIVRFTAYTNRGGYFVLRLASGQDRQVWVEQIVEGKPILIPEVPSELVDASQRAALETEITEILRLARLVPGAQGELTKLAQPLRDAIAKLDAGEVLIDGRWEPIADYRRRRFEALDAQLRRSLAEERVKAQFLLAENSSYRSMQDLAKDDPALEEKLRALIADRDRLVSVERQDEIIQQLSKAGLATAMADSLLDRLKTFPDPGERTTRVLDQAMTAAALSAKADEVRAALEAFYAGQTLETALPALPTDLAEGIRSLGMEVRKYHAAKPPEGIPLPADRIRAAVDIQNETPAINSMLANKKFAEAAKELDRLSNSAAAIGPAARGAFLTLRTHATTQVDLFDKLRTEGEEAEKANDIPGALTKFREALDLCADPALEARIKEMQSNLPL